MTTTVSIEVDITKVEINENSNAYSWSFKSDHHGELPVSGGQLNLLVATNTEVCFNVVSKITAYTPGTNFFDGKLYSSGSSTFIALGATADSSGQDVTISLSQLSELGVAVAVSETGCSLTPVNQGPILGIYQSGLDFFLPPNNSLEFFIAKSQQTTYYLEAAAVTWNTMDKTQPSWIGYSVPNPGISVNIQNNGSSKTTVLQEASFSLNIKPFKTGSEIRVDPTVVNRGSMTDMWEPGT